MLRQRREMMEQQGTLEIDSQEMRAPGFVLPTFRHEDAMGTEMKTDKEIEKIGPIDIIDDDAPVAQAASAQAPTTRTSSASAPPVSALPSPPLVTLPHEVCQQQPHEVGQQPPDVGQEPPDVGQKPPAGGQKRSADSREERKKKEMKLVEEAVGSPSARTMVLKCAHTYQNLSDMPPAVGTVFKALLQKHPAPPNTRENFTVTYKAERYRV